MAGFIGAKASVVSSGAERKKTYAITTTTTSLTGLAYTPSKVHVYHNGIRLVDGTDYTATDGTSITLTTAAENGDEVVVISYATFQTSDTVSASAGGTFSNDIEITGDLTVGANLDVSSGTIKLDGNYPVGTGNVALGNTALDSNVSGNANTAIGNNALTANTASDNTGLGYFASENNTTGTSNVSVGRSTMRSTTSGSYNTAVGRSALEANTTASNNTAVGYQAGYSNTTAVQSVYLGAQAGYTSTSAQNTFLGYYCGRNNTTGHANTFIGESSGNLVSTGAKNTILGRFSGNQGGLDIRTSSNNIVLSDGDGNPRVYVSGGGYAKFRSENSSYLNTAGKYHEFNHDEPGSTAFVISQESSTFVNTSFYIQNARTNSSNYSFVIASSGGGSDNEFKLRGDGNAYADGSWSGGGADYAEYFEWDDGNTANEDRRGFSVVLVNNKMRKATADDDASSIIGVVSGNPSVVGDTDMDAWKHKYLRDDYGTYQRDENDERILNPDYNPDQEYTSRENRPEWDTVGLMGKLRIRKGQPTGYNWIKMRDVSDTVEEWLVR